MKRKKVVRFLSYLSILFFIGIIVGCAIMPTRGEVGKPIKDNLVSKIQPGKTTREEIIQWFGIPTAVAKKGEKIALPSAIASPVGGAEMGSFTEVSSDTYFILFSNREITEEHRVYLYIHTKSAGMGLSVPFVHYMGGRTAKNILAILMDEKKGVVEDYKFDKQI